MRTDLTDLGLTDPELRRQPGVEYDLTSVDPTLRGLNEAAIKWTCDMFTAGEVIPLPDILRERADAVEFTSPDWATKYR